MTDGAGEGSGRTLAFGVATTCVMGAVGAALDAIRASPSAEERALLWAAVAIVGVAIVWARSTQDRRRRERAEDVGARRALMERVGSIGDRIELHSAALASVMRSDLIHKAQKYVYELRWATAEEKASWFEEYQQYKALGADGYIDGIVSMVVALPSKPQGPGEEDS